MRTHRHTELAFQHPSNLLGPPLLPTASASFIIRRAAVHGEAASCIPLNLSDVWEDFALGRLRVAGSHAVGDRVHMLARVADRAEENALSLTEAAVLIRVLCGEQQKAVAADLAIAPSTASHRRMDALRKLGIEGEPVPLGLVVTAAQASGIDVGPANSCIRFAYEGALCTMLSVPRPDAGCLHMLTRAEQAVACLFIEGRSRSEIAIQRGTSMLTVAGQVHSIFSALGLSGRFALIRRAAELGCFGISGTQEKTA